MIQRIQSIYLAIASLLMVLLFVFPVWKVNVTDPTTNYSFFVHQSIIEKQTPPASDAKHLAKSPTNIITQLMWDNLVLNSLIAGFCIFIVFQFRNRGRQAKLALVAAGVIVILYIHLYLYLNSFVNANQLSLQSGITPTIAFPAIAIILLLLAANNIRKDEAKVRNADRLR